MKKSISKKYFLFGGDRFYPKGGFGDLLGSYNSIISCKRKLKIFFKKEFISDGWGHIVLNNKVIQVGKYDDFRSKKIKWKKK